MNKAERERQKKFKKQTKVGKGGPSGVVVSLIVHAAAFFAAGVFVVFKVLPKPPPVFEAPPPIQRPKMNLKKPKVRIQKSSTPKPSSRIVAKVTTAKMPEIALPDVMGTGEGLLGGLGGLGGDFMEMPDINNVSMLGSTESIGVELVGTFYDLKRTRSGGPKPMTSTDDFIAIINDFLSRGWRTSEFSKYYRMSTKLYLTCLVCPAVNSSFGPVAFGDYNACEGSYWIVHYKGKFVHKEKITFRFWAASDMFLVVRVNGKIVVASAWDTIVNQFNRMNDIYGNLWTPKAPENRRYIYGRFALASVGDWITLEAGVPQDIEILVGDDSAGDYGGGFCAYLLVEEKGVDYPKGNQGGPILPVFRLAELSHDMIDAIYPYLPQDEELCLTNGPVFNDF